MFKFKSISHRENFKIDVDGELFDYFDFDGIQKNGRRISQLYTAIRGKGWTIATREFENVLRQCGYTVDRTAFDHDGLPCTAVTKG